MVRGRPRESGAQRWAGGFPALCTAQAVAVFADQCVRMAAAWLVFDRTSSTILAALTYLLMGALTIVLGRARVRPAERRRVLTAVELARISLAVLLSWDGLPMVAWWAAVILFGLAGRHRAAALPEPSEIPYEHLALWSVTGPYVRMFGFAAGGLLPMAVGVRPMLYFSAFGLGLGALLAWAGDA